MKVAIYGQYYKKKAAKYLKKLFQVLDEINANVVIESTYYESLSQDFKTLKSYATFSSYKDLNSDYTMFFSIGGDGAFLRAITYVRGSNIPILGINIGRLGFLANVKKNEIKEAVLALHNKEFKLKERALLIVATNQEIEGFKDFDIALNEVTVVRKDSTAMITIETHLNDAYLTSYWADGLIVATPTGSTGYSLSCGGPVITPNAKNIVLTPIAPHNLNARPLVIPDDTEIKLKVIGREKFALLSLDSRILIIPNNTEVIIKKANFTIKTVELHNQSFLKTLREKLLWGEDVRNNK